MERTEPRTSIVYNMSINRLNRVNPIIGICYFSKLLEKLGKNKHAQPDYIISDDVSILEEISRLKLSVSHSSNFQPTFVKHARLNELSKIPSHYSILVEDIVVPSKGSLEHTVVDIMQDMFKHSVNINQSRIVLPDLDSYELLAYRLKKVEEHYLPNGLIGHSDKLVEQMGNLVGEFDKLADEEIKKLTILNQVCREQLKIHSIKHILRSKSA